MKKVTLVLMLLALGATSALAQDMEARQVILSNYLAAWSEPDADQRMEYLEASFAEEGEYSDPVSIAESRQALSNLIGMYQDGDAAGVYFKLLDAPEYHNEIYGRFDWVMMSPGSMSPLGCHATSSPPPSSGTFANPATSTRLKNARITRRNST